MKSKNESFIHTAERILLLSQQSRAMFKVIDTRCSHACAKTLTSAVNCVVNDALVHSTPTMHTANAAVTF